MSGQFGYDETSRPPKMAQLSQVVNTKQIDKQFSLLNTTVLGVTHNLTLMHEKYQKLEASDQAKSKEIDQLKTRISHTEKIVAAQQKSLSETQALVLKLMGNSQNSVKSAAIQQTMQKAQNMQKLTNLAERKIAESRQEIKMVDYESASQELMETSDRTVEPQAEPTPEPKAESKPELRPEPKAEPKAELKPEPKPEPKADLKPTPTPEPKADPKIESKPEPKAELKSEPKEDSSSDEDSDDIDDDIDNILTGSTNSTKMSTPELVSGSDKVSTPELLELEDQKPSIKQKKEESSDDEVEISDSSESESSEEEEEKPQPKKPVAKSTAATKLSATVVKAVATKKATVVLKKPVKK